MKNIIKIYLLLFLVFACSKDADTTIEDGLTAQVAALNAQIITLQSQIATLQSTGNSVSTQLATAQASLTEAQGSLVTSTADAADLAERLALVSASLNAVDFTSVNKIDAVGSVQDQSPAQAKQTIYGRWNVDGLSAKSYGCQFNFIEFTNDNYLMQITLGNGEKGTLFGEYELTEDANGKVSNVNLLFDTGAVNVTVGILTNIIVTATSSESFSATFDVVLTLPTKYADCDSALSGNYTAPKQAPLPECKTTTALSNHGKIIGEWTMESFSANSSEEAFSLVDLLTDICRVEENDAATGQSTDTIDPNCAPASKLVINISTFGTYSITWVAANGSPLHVEIQSWNWLNNDQTLVNLNQNPVGYQIVKLNENSLIVSSQWQDEEGQISEEISFSKSVN